MSAFTVDYLPAVVAFCQARIHQIAPDQEPISTSREAARLDELRMIITLCEGLGKQHDLLAKTLRLPTQEEVDRLNEGQPFPKPSALTIEELLRNSPPPNTIPDLPPKEAEPRTAYFTFGQSHVHSVNGKTFDKDCVVKITSPDPRGVMWSYFNNKWAMEYDEPPDPFFYPRGVFELP